MTQLAVRISVDDRSHAALCFSQITFCVVRSPWPTASVAIEPKCPGPHASFLSIDSTAMTSTAVRDRSSPSPLLFGS